MGEHNHNPQAIAKRNGQHMVQLSDLGDGVGFAGFEVRPLMTVAGECDCKLDVGHAPGCASVVSAVAGLFAIGGRVSNLMPSVELRAVLVGELGRIPVDVLKRLLVEEKQETPA
jgi:hypothetical protein